MLTPPPIPVRRLALPTELIHGQRLNPTADVEVSMNGPDACGILTVMLTVLPHPFRNGDDTACQPINLAILRFSATQTPHCDVAAAIEAHLEDIATRVPPAYRYFPAANPRLTPARVVGLDA